MELQSVNLNPSAFTSKEAEVLERMLHDRAFRIALVRKSHFWFFHYYFGKDYVKYRTADFQKDILNLTQNPTYQNIVICAFRGSGKSTLVTLSYVIWSILGEQQKKYVIILGRTQLKAQINLQAIKRELESNALLRQDLGPFREEDNQWAALSLILPQYGAKISTGSIEQSIRGMRHYQHRPDLFICDDLEDMDSVRTQESRDKLFEWLTGDVLPAGNLNTRMVFIGTPLHEDSLLRRLEKLFENDNVRNVFRRYPILDENGICIWPGKFCSKADIEAEKARCLNIVSWQREYMLKIVQSENQIVKREWITYYDELPASGRRDIATAIDPARSLKQTADSTAMVSGEVHGTGNDRRLYILPNIVNAKLTTEQLIGRAKAISFALGNGFGTKVYVEDVMFQAVLADLLRLQGIPAKGYPIRGQTKEGRLQAVAALIELGIILFPRTGAEELIEQIIGFGSEKHDDLVDAFTIVVLQLLENTKRRPSVQWL
jgi:predicted phage terminase large subunit-like protein